MSTVIKTSLFYLYGEQLDTLKELIPEAVEKLFPNGDGDLAQVLTKVPKTKFTPDLNMDYSSMPIKHRRTFLLYFEEMEHKLFNDYLNKMIKDSNLLEHKKKARTQFLIKVLNKILNK